MREVMLAVAYVTMGVSILLCLAPLVIKRCRGNLSLALAIVVADSLAAIAWLFCAQYIAAIIWFLLAGYQMFFNYRQMKKAAP